MKRGIMVDLETLSTRPNSIIMSIGAVMFDENGLGDEFYVNIDPRPQVEYGFHCAKDTLEWWSNHKEAYEALKVNQLHFIEAITKFCDWAKYGKSYDWWSNCTKFDFAILDSAIWKCQDLGHDVHFPYNHWDINDYRTICNVLGLPNSSWRSFQEKESGSVYHNALDDAKGQALALIEMLKVFD